MGRRLGLLCLTTFVCAISASAQTPNQPRSSTADMTEADLQTGRQIFTVHCARCHGMLGEGGEGPSFIRARLTHAADDQSLFDVIAQGIPGTAMPGTFAINETGMWQLAAYVKSLGRLPPEASPGDPVSGEAIYVGKGACTTCHISQGIGRGVGPELTDVGLRRNADYLRRSLTTPEADQPMKNSWLTGRTNAFLTVRVVSEEGEFEGMRVNEDEFSIQMRDLTGQLYSFDKRTLLSFAKAEGHSLMPGYTTVLSDAEIDDLVAYLMALKGSKGDDA